MGTDGFLRLPLSTQSIGDLSGAAACCSRFLLTCALLMTSSHSKGLTSDVNYGSKISGAMHMHVTLHEIGHNFGASHDTAGCSLSSGNNVMWQV